MHTLLVTIGRIILGLFFVAHGLMFAKALTDPQMMAGLSGYIASRGLPQPQLIVYGVVAFEILAGLAIVFGFLVAPIAFVLAGFCVATAVLFHNFWTMPGDKAPNEIAHFVKNIGLAGAFLVLAGESIRVRVAN